MNRINKMAISISGAKLIAFAILELGLHKGLWSLWLNNDLPLYVTDSGAAELIVAAYVMWLFVEPIVNGIALITKERPLVLKNI